MSQVQGYSNTIAEVDSTFRALRVSSRPPEILSAQRVSGKSGNLGGIGTDTQVYSYRWGDSSGKLALIRYVDVEFVLTTAFSSAQRMAYEMYIARSFTVSASSGTTVLSTPTTANNQNMRTSQADSLVTMIQIATTGILVTGTQTLDTMPIGATQAYMGAVGAKVGRTRLYDATTDPVYPLTLAQNEGFVIRNAVAMGTGGIGVLTVDVGWQEVASY